MDLTNSDSCKKWFEISSDIAISLASESTANTSQNIPKPYIETVLDFWKTSVEKRNLTYNGLYVAFYDYGK